MAAGRGFTGIVDLLLKAGAAVDDRDANGATPLHLATAQGYEEVMQILIAAGSMSGAQNDPGTEQDSLSGSNSDKGKMPMTLCMEHKGKTKH